MEYDTQSWKDRCNRYFSSISDTEKDRGQEKDTRDGDHKLNNKTGKREELDDIESWRDLATLRKKIHENRTLSNIRKYISVLDIHGAKYGGKAASTIELVLWIFIICATVSVSLFLVWTQVREYQNMSANYETISVTTKPFIDGNTTPVFSICNKNLMKKSSLHGTKFEFLTNIDKGVPVVANPSGPTPATVDAVVETNKRLYEFIKNTNHLDVSEIIREIKEDITVSEIMKRSNVSVESRLSSVGNPDMLKDIIQASLVDIRTMGHTKNDMMMDCWVGERHCRDSEVVTVASEEFGNCLTIVTESPQVKVQLILNAQAEEYINSLSPSLGFVVSVHNSNSDLGQGQMTMVSPNQHISVKVAKETIIKRIERKCDQSIGQKKKCQTSCIETSIQRLCGCKGRASAKSSQPLCSYKDVSRYICLKAVLLLERKGHLGCSCKENCIDSYYEVQESKEGWPSSSNMQRIMAYVSQKHTALNESQIRKNLVKVSIHLEPERRERRQEVEQITIVPILDLLSKIGGLSALVAGISLVTLLELVWTLVRLAINTVMHYNRRSNTPNSMEKLSDSEITSITWAMYKQKRRREEVDKEQQKEDRNKGQHVLGGNAHSRIAKRNNYLATVTEDGDISNTGKDVANDASYIERHSNTHLENKHQSAHNGYRRNVEHVSGRRSASFSDNKEMFKVMDQPYSGIHMLSRPKTPEYIYSDGRTLYQHNGKANSRHTSEHVSRNSGLYPERGRFVTPADAIQLHGGYSAYFHANNVSEPMYL